MNTSKELYLKNSDYQTIQCMCCGHYKPDTEADMQLFWLLVPREPENESPDQLEVDCFIGNVKSCFTVYL